MARRGRGSKKGRSALPKKARRPQKPSKLKTGRGARRSQRASARQPNSRLRELDAVNIYRQGKVKTVSAAARAAGTTLKAMWNLVPRVIE
jgi:hypothetical protein